jgi:hypothetical protein
MTPHRRFRATVVASWMLALAASAVAQKPPPIKLSSPSVMAPPEWSRTLQMPDGRTFVSDGGLALDATFAKPAKLPSTVIPPVSAKIVAGHMAAPFDKEIGLGELRPGSLKNSFVTPDGIGLNGNYVTFLREVLPAAKTRLRTKGKRDPVVIVTDAQTVGVVMPMVMPEK